MVSAISHMAPGIADRIVTPVTAKNALSASQINTNGLWDTGAQNSAITTKAATLLGLMPVKKANIRGVHGVQEVNVYFIEIVLNNPDITVKCLVTECSELSNDGSVDLLLGMNVISRGDFSISNYNGHTTMTFRVPSLEDKNYVEELKDYIKVSKIHQQWIKHGNNKCPCGSGKSFDNCHGKSIYHNK